MTHHGDVSHGFLGLVFRRNAPVLRDGRDARACYAFHVHGDVLRIPHNDRGLYDFHNKPRLFSSAIRHPAARTQPGR